MLSHVAKTTIAKQSIELKIKQSPQLDKSMLSHIAKTTIAKQSIELKIKQAFTRDGFPGISLL